MCSCTFPGNASGASSGARRRFSISHRNPLAGHLAGSGRDRAHGRSLFLSRIRGAFVAILILAVFAACQQTDPVPSASAAEAPTALPAPEPTTTLAPEPTAISAPEPASTVPPAPTATSAPTIPSTMILIDTIGREVELPSEPPNRIISLAPSTTEILFAIGARDRLIAVDDFSNYPADAVGLPTIGSFSPDLERIVALEPDLVLGSTLTSAEVIQKIEALNIPVLIVGSFDVRGVADSIVLLGQAVGEADAAKEVAAELTTRVDAVVAAVADRLQPRVFHELDASDPVRPFTVGPGNFVHDLITLAGGENVFGDAETPYPQVGLEDVIARDPEIIILADGPFGTTIESVQSRAGWEGINAVQNGAFMEITPELSDQISRPGPRIADGLEAVARFLHPEAFE